MYMIALLLTAEASHVAFAPVHVVSADTGPCACTLCLSSRYPNATCCRCTQADHVAHDKAVSHLAGQLQVITRKLTEAKVPSLFLNAQSPFCLYSLWLLISHHARSAAHTLLWLDPCRADESSDERPCMVHMLACSLREGQVHMPDCLHTA